MPPDHARRALLAARRTAPPIALLTALSLALAACAATGYEKRAAFYADKGDTDRAMANYLAAGRSSSAGGEYATSFARDRCGVALSRAGRGEVEDAVRHVAGLRALLAATGAAEHGVAECLGRLGDLAARKDAPLETRVAWLERIEAELPGDHAAGTRVALARLEQQAAAPHVAAAAQLAAGEARDAAAFHVQMARRYGADPGVAVDVAPPAVDFRATVQGPCAVLGPALAALSSTPGGTPVVVRVRVDRCNREPRTREVTTWALKPAGTYKSYSTQDTGSGQYEWKESPVLSPNGVHQTDSRGNSRWQRQLVEKKTQKVVETRETWYTHQPSQIEVRTFVAEVTASIEMTLPDGAVQRASVTVMRSADERVARSVSPTLQQLKVWELRKDVSDKAVGDEAAQALVEALQREVEARGRAALARAALQQAPADGSAALGARYLAGRLGRDAPLPEVGQWFDERYGIRPADLPAVLEGRRPPRQSAVASLGLPPADAAKSLATYSTTDTGTAGDIEALYALTQPGLSVRTRAFRPPWGDVGPLALDVGAEYRMEDEDSGDVGSFLFGVSGTTLGDVSGYRLEAGLVALFSSALIVRTALGWESLEAQGAADARPYRNLFLDTDFTLPLNPWLGLAAGAKWNVAKLSDSSDDPSCKDNLATCDATVKHHTPLRAGLVLSLGRFALGAEALYYLALEPVEDAVGFAGRLDVGF